MKRCSAPANSAAEVGTTGARKQNPGASAESGCQNRIFGQIKFPENQYQVLKVDRPNLMLLVEEFQKLHTMDIITFAAVSGTIHGAIMVACNEGIFCRAKLNVLKLWRKIRAPFSKWKWNPQLKRFVEVDFERFYWYLRHPEAITKDTYAKALGASLVVVQGNNWHLRKFGIPSRWSYDFDSIYKAFRGMSDSKEVDAACECYRSLPESELKAVVTSTAPWYQERLKALGPYEHQRKHLDNLFPSAITSELIDEKIEEIQRGNDGH